MYRIQKYFIGSLLLLLIFQDILWSKNQAKKEEKQNVPIFYPFTPAEPRIQFLTTINDSSIVKPRKSGFFKFVFGKDKEKDKIISIVKPYGLAMHDGRLYICDLRTGLICLDFKEKKTTLIGTEGPGQLSKPVNIHIDQTGRIYVADITRRQILCFSEEGRFLQAYGKSGDFKPSDVTVYKNRLYVADLEKHQIVVLDKKSGEIVSRLGKAGSDEGELFHPTNLTCDSEGNLYVSETSNFRISVFGHKGDFIRTFGKIGQEPGTFARNKGIAIDGDRNLWVVDAAFENIQIFDVRGRLLLFFLRPGNSPGNINLPVDIWIDYDNIKYFKDLADPHFKIKFLLFVSSQFGVNKINVYGCGKYSK